MRFVAIFLRNVFLYRESNQNNLQMARIVLMTTLLDANVSILKKDMCALQQHLFLFKKILTTPMHKSMLFYNTKQKLKHNSRKIILNMKLLVKGAESSRDRKPRHELRILILEFLSRMFWLNNVKNWKIARRRGANEIPKDVKKQ